MNDNKKGLPAGLIGIIVIAVLLIFRPAIGKVLTTGILLVGILFVAAAVLLTIWAMADGKKEAEKRKAAKAQADAGKQDLHEIHDAEEKLRQIEDKLESVSDIDIRNKGAEVIASAERIIQAIREQPKELKRTSQFRTSYLPSLLTVYTQYEKLEDSGSLRPGDKEKLLSFSDDTLKAFDAQYSALFKDEQFDMDVEIRAARMIFRRDGMLSDGGPK